MSAKESVIFIVKDHKLEVRAKETLGHGIFKDDKFIHFIPISSRDDLKSITKVLKKLGLSDSQLEEALKYTSEHFENELKAPTTTDLIKTSLALSAVAEKALNREIEVDCHEKTSKNNIPKISKEKKEPQKTAEVYCECELPKGAIAKFEKATAPSFEGEYFDDFSLLGDLESSEFTINTTNDNHLHGLWKKFSGAESDGNDRGRTFGLNLDYKLKGSDGEFRIMFESTIFTQLKETSPGSNNFYIRRDGNGDTTYLQDLLERNRLDISLRKNLDVNDMFLIGGVELEQLTDNGSFSDPIQKAWHGAWDSNTVQYENQDFMDDKMNLTVYGGLGKDWLHDLGKWKCRTRIEGTIGQNLLDVGDTFAKVRTEVELNSNEVFGGSEDNPYFLISMWAQGSAETQGGHEKGAGIQVAFPIKVNDWQIKPHFGISIKDEKEDRLFTQSQSMKIEPESSIGITFSKKF
jgi:hypothetical protein